MLDAKGFPAPTHSCRLPPSEVKPRTSADRPFRLLRHRVLSIGISANGRSHPAPAAKEAPAKTDVASLELGFGSGRRFSLPPSGSRRSSLGLAAAPSAREEWEGFAASASSARGEWGCPGVSGSPAHGERSPAAARAGAGLARCPAPGRSPHAPAGGAAARRPRFGG